MSEQSTTFEGEGGEGLNLNLNDGGGPIYIYSPSVLDIRRKRDLLSPRIA